MGKEKPAGMAGLLFTAYLRKERTLSAWQFRHKSLSNRLGSGSNGNSVIGAPHLAQVQFPLYI
jgi:hypothetical protein